MLQAGPVAAGYDEDQRWTLARVGALIRTLFHRTLSLHTVSVLLHREGWTPQQPIHGAAERDQAAITHWRRYQWPAVKGRARAGQNHGGEFPPGHQAAYPRRVKRVAVGSRASTNPPNHQSESEYSRRCNERSWLGVRWDRRRQG